MMLHILGSNSAGNCYILQNDQEALIIEAGIRVDRIKQAIGFKVSKVAGCLLTHEHLDHSAYINEVMAAGVNVYATKGTFSARGINGHYRAIHIEKNRQVKIGSFTILPFDVKHDAMEPVGFLISHPETGNILFVTDTYYVSYTFKDLHNIIVEANYSQEIIDEKLREGASPKFLRDRVLQSHMSLDTCLGLLKANDLSQVNNIVLIHLSDKNSHAERFQGAVKGLTGKNVHVGAAGMAINFDKQPF